MPFSWKQPEAINDLVKLTLDKLKLTPKIKQHEVLAHWEAIVGTAIAERSRPLRILGDTLFVEADHPTWVQELNLMKERFLERISEEHPESGIRKIRFQLK